MKFEKINQEVLKRCIKGQEVAWAEKDNCYYIMMEGYAGAWIVPKSDWYIDLKAEGYNRCFIKRVDNIVTRIFGDKTYETLSYIKDNGECIALPYGKKKLMAKILKFDDGTSVYVNSALLTCFDEHNVRYIGADSKSPIYVFEGAECVGVVMPINIDKYRKEA